LNSPEKIPIKILLSNFEKVLDKTSNWMYNIRKTASWLNLEVNMPEFSLDGFSFVHLEERNVLRERRVILGLTQKEVADKAKIPMQSYQRFESGERNIMTASFQMTCRVLQALELDITKFYNGDYAIGEEIYESKEGLRYKKTGKLVEEDVE